jgi:hypothetical protein
MKLTEREKHQILQANALGRGRTQQPPRPRLLSPAEYFARIEQLRRVLPPPAKQAFCTGDHWRL